MIQKVSRASSRIRVVAIFFATFSLLSVAQALPASSAPVFVDGFEGGSLEKWSVQACEDDRAKVYTAQSEPTWPAPAEGESAVRLMALNSDVSPCTPTGNPRSQIIADEGMKPGSEVWQAWSVLFPENFPELSSWHVFQQDHGDPFNGSPSLGFGASGNELSLDRGEQYGYDRVWTAPLQRNHWYQFLVHKKLATDESGFVEFWLDGVPQTLDGQTRLTTQTMHSDASGDYAFYLANYRDSGIADSVEVFFDDVRIGATRDDVGSNLKATKPLTKTPTRPGLRGVKSEEFVSSGVVRGQGPAATQGTLAGAARTPASLPSPMSSKAGPTLTNPTWEGDFETGDLSQFFHWPDWGGSLEGAEKPTVVDDPLGSGSKVGKFTIEPGGKRTELYIEEGKFSNGDKMAFAFSVLLEDGFPTDEGWQLITQWKNDGTGSPPMELSIEGGNYTLSGGHMIGKNFREEIGPAKTGVWTDFVFEIEFEGGGGSVDAWLNGEQALSGFTPPGGTLYSGKSSYLKTGYYRNTAIGATGTVYFDNWQIAKL